MDTDITLEHSNYTTTFTCTASLTTITLGKEKVMILKRYKKPCKYQ